MSLSALLSSSRAVLCVKQGTSFVASLGLFLILCFMLCGVAAAQEFSWFDGNRPKAEAWQAIDVLSAAAEEGLDAEHYGAEPLRRAFDAAKDDPALPAESVARLDQELTEAMLRYLYDVHFGQIDPRRISENFSVRLPNGFNPASHLQSVMRENRLGEAAILAAPPLPLYANLRLALAHYRKLAGDPVFSQLWQTPLPPLPNRKLEIGETYAGLPLLTLRLITLGDLPGETVITDRYEGHIVKGVMDFQTRHGLTPDGVIGRQTFAELNVSPSARVRQIGLSMERLRWTPLLQSARMIAVNIPEHMLEAYEVRDGEIEVKVSMRVIIGSALDTRTPLFDEDMRFIEFSPNWNVPISIARSEVIPKIYRDPSYFARQGFEFVSGDGSVSTALSFESLEAVRRGQMRIRQRPGPKNALGDIKFIFPNKDNIYLHHTPSPGLFERDRRDLSHGCIRVEEPVELAKFVLENDPVWNEERIREAMTKQVSSTLRLREPVRVVLAYNTVQVRDGRVYFFPDIYGQDNLLDQALRRSVRDSHIK